LNIQPGSLKDVQVLMTMVGGIVEYCAAGIETICLPSPVDSSISPPPGPAADQPVAASAELPGSSASNAFDGSIDTLWNSGGGPEQWIQIDLGEARTISSIRLTVAQFPEGETVHQIWVGIDANNMTLVHEFSGVTQEFDILEFAPTARLENIQFIKIVTTQSPSWVAWREIEVIED
jgi:hypothetical protein